MVYAMKMGQGIMKQLTDFWNRMIAGYYEIGGDYQMTEFHDIYKTKKRTWSHTWLIQGQYQGEGQGHGHGHDQGQDQGEDQRHSQGHC